MCRWNMSRVPPALWSTKEGVTCGSAPGKVPSARGKGRWPPCGEPAAGGPPLRGLVRHQGFSVRSPKPWELGLHRGREVLCPSLRDPDLGSPVPAGRVTGRFYGEDGLPTPALSRVEAMIARGAEAGQRALEEKQTFPPCNAEWSSSRGSRLWCSPERYTEVCAARPVRLGDAVARLPTQAGSSRAQVLWGAGLNSASVSEASGVPGNQGRLGGGARVCLWFA